MDRVCARTSQIFFLTDVIILSYVNLITLSLFSFVLFIWFQAEMIKTESTDRLL